MLSFKSDTFQEARKDLVDFQKEFASRNETMSRKDMEDFLQTKNIDAKSFDKAEEEFNLYKKNEKNKIYNFYKDKIDKTQDNELKKGIVQDYNRDLSKFDSTPFRPEGFKIGRIVAGAVGEAGRDIKRTFMDLAPETGEALGKKVSDILPDELEKDIGAFFDPYYGEGTNAEIDRFLSDIGSYLVPGGIVTKGITKGSKLLKVGKGLGPNARRLRKYGRLGKYAVGGAAAATIAEDPETENIGNLIESLSINPDDPAANQYLDAFINNLLVGGVIPVTGAVKSLFKFDAEKGLQYATKDDVKKKLVKKILDKRNVEKNKITEIESIPFGKGKFSRFIKEKILPDRGTDKFTLNRILIQEGAAGKALEEADGLTQDLLRAVKKAVSPDLSKQQIDDLVQDVLETRNPNAMRLLKTDAPEVAAIVTKMNDNLFKARKHISKYIDDEDLQAIYDPTKNKVYLNRAYRIHDDPNFTASIKNLDNATIKRIEDFLRKEMKIKDEDIPKAMRDLVRKDVGSTEVFQKVFKDVGAGSSKTFKARTKLAESKDIRSLWGEVKDPYKNFARTYEKLAQIKSEADFVTDMADYLKKSGLAMDEETLVKKGLVKESDKLDPFSLEAAAEKRLSRVFGTKEIQKGSIINPLKGLYANPSYKKFIEEGTDVLAPSNPIMRKFLQYKVISQTSKTVYNPATHGRNTLGNMILLVANGMNPFRSGKDNAFKALSKKITGQSNEALGKRLGRYHELGVSDSGVNQQTLRRAAGQVFNFDEGTILNKLSKSKTASLPQNLYQSEDDFFKILHFENTIDELKKIMPKGTSIDIIEQEAAKRTRELMPNYGLVGKGFKELRNLPLGDFIAFPAEMMRISWNLGKRTIDDLTGKTVDELENLTGKKLTRDAKNKIKNMGYKRLAGFTVAGTAGEQVQNYTANRLNISSDEVKAIENLSPEYEQGAAKIFLSGVNKDKNGHVGVNYINLGPIDPFNYLKAPALIVGRELASIAQGKPTPYYKDSFGTAMRQVLSPFLGTSMVTDALIDSLDTIEDKSLFLNEKLLQIGENLTKVVIPGVVPTALKEMEYSKSKQLREDMGLGAVSKYDYTIPEVEMEGPLGSAKWLGIRPQRLDITASMRRQVLPPIKEMEKTTNMNNFVNNPNSPRGPERAQQFSQAYVDDQLKRLAQFKNLKKIVDSYDDLGLNPKEVLGGLSKRFLKNINFDNVVEKMEFARRNKFLPSFIPEGLIPYAEEYTGGPLPYKAVSNIYRELFTRGIIPEEKE